MTNGNYQLIGIDHVQLAMPSGPGAEAMAVAFYVDVFGLSRVPKPPELSLRGGCWFEYGHVKLHLGVEEPFISAKKAHPALVVDNLPALLTALETAGFPTRRAEDVPGRPQWYVDDPFGNRIELMNPSVD